jgi:flagellar basal body rod protein FlgG
VKQLINPIFSALSALAALGEKLGVTGNNIANMNTEGFKKSRAILEEAAPSGVTVSINRIDTPGSPLPSEGGGQGVRESSNVAVEQEMVDLITTKDAYTANLKTIKTEEEILGTLFDVLDK